MRRWLAELAGMPAPGLIGGLNAPLARRFALRSGANEERIRDAIAELPDMLDHVDRLIASGVIGLPDPSAADFQIGSSVRVVLAFPGLHPMAERRPARDLALRLFPRYPEPIPAALPLA